MFACFNCKQRAFLIRGLCEKCDPQLHNNHRFMLDTMGKLSEDFEKETGVSSLSDWYRFEEFMTGRLANTETGQRFGEILTDEEVSRNGHKVEA